MSIGFTSIFRVQRADLSNTTKFATIMKLHARHSLSRLIFLAGYLCCWAVTLMTARGNPLVSHIFTADPTARAFGDRVYLYVTHDEPDATYWNTVDWRLFSTSDMVTWKDHGAIFDLKGFSWATKWAWAPECVKANGRYYLFLPTDRSKIGVAVSDSPEGPFKDAIGKPLIDNVTMPEAGPEPIDPAVLVDDDGQFYLFFGCRDPKVVKLDATLTKLAGSIKTLAMVDAQGKPLPIAVPGKNPVLPEGYGEAPFIFKRAGKYYFVYSNGWAKESTLVYALGDAPTGPFTYVGKVMEHVACVTHHASIVEFHGKWFVFYHTSEISNGNVYRRGVCADELTFDATGKIIPVTATKQGPAKVGSAAH